MEENFLQDWATKLNIPLDRLKGQFEDAKSEMKGYFPNQDDAIIFEKAKLKLKVDHKRKFLGSAVSFVGIVVGSESARDPFAGIRNKQLSLYKKALEASNKVGDTTILQKMFDNEIVRKGEEGEIIALWPKLKKNREKNKVAGKDMPNSSESLVQTVYAVGMPTGTTEPRAVFLELRGKACNQNLYEGKPVSWRAINKTTEKDTTYVLSTRNTEFLLSDNAFFKEGLEKKGVTGLIGHFFKNMLCTWEDVNAWVVAKNADPKKDVVPEQYKNCMVIEESMCIYQNFDADAKGRIKINICSTSDDLNDTTVLCMADKSLDASIDFAQGSKVMTMGRPWLPEPRDGKDTNLVLWASGMFAYNDYKIPRVKVPKVKAEEVSQEPAPVVVDTTAVTNAELKSTASDPW